jgi:toxin HigB-1
VRIRTFAHKGLRRLYEEDNAKGLPPDAGPKLRAMLTFMQDMASTQKLYTVPAWKAHQLTGSRKNTWSLHVTRNWRLTFRVDQEEICEVDYEDYH